MRRIFVCLCALALAIPLSAQEKAPAPTQTPVVTSTTTTPARTGLLSRIFGGRSSRMETTSPAMTTTSTITSSTSTTMMEPVYNSRGRITGYRPMTTTPANMKTAEMPKPTDKPNTVSQASATTPMKEESKVVPANYVEPQPERRGLLSRIFRR